MRGSGIKKQTAQEKAQVPFQRSIRGLRVTPFRRVDSVLEYADHTVKMYGSAQNAFDRVDGQLRGLIAGYDPITEAFRLGDWYCSRYVEQLIEIRDELAKRVKRPPFDRKGMPGQ